MNNELMKSFKLIGEIKSCISKTDNFEDAVRETLKLYMNKIPCNYAIFWCADEKNEFLKPLYWLGNKDFVDFREKINDSLVGNVFESQKSVRFFEKISWGGIDNISSMVVVPFISTERTIGCIQIISCSDENRFTDEEADIAELAALLIATEIDDKQLIHYEWPYKEILLSAKNISRSFINGDTVSKVLKGISFNIYKGEFLVILGESGCGKSTLLNILGGMDSPTDGTFSFMGKDMGKATDKELTAYRRNNIGFIFQSYNLMPNLTAKQNLDIISELVTDKMDSLDALALVGLQTKGNNYPTQLSGGQQQRISIARSLVKKPALIFADEPTAALDYTTSIEVLTVIENVIKSGTTMVMITHNEEIAKMANRVIRLRNGMIYETSINKKTLHASDLVW